MGGDGKGPKEPGDRIWRERLPENCPPANAHAGPCEQAFRFVTTASPTAEDFESYSAKGIPVGENEDPCRWASCSLYPDYATVLKKRKIKSLKRYPFVAEMKIRAGSGRIIQSWWLELRESVFRFSSIANRCRQIDRGKASICLSWRGGCARARRHFHGNARFL